VTVHGSKNLFGSLPVKAVAQRAALRRSLAVACLVLGSTAFGAASSSQLAPSPSSLSSWPGNDLFTNGPVLRLSIDIRPEELDRLRHDDRKFVHATLTEGETVYRNVAVRLKGSVGSFRPIEDKPAWTLDFSRFNPGEKFHGLRRIHLNNSVEDPSYCNEWIGNELFRQAGVPAPRVTHALVSLGDRRLGLYVVKEGFTEDFLACYFKDIGGNLFEPGEGHDVNQRLKRVSVAAAQASRAPLETLAKVVADKDAPDRWSRLERILDTKAFLNFMAAEVLLCHRDGYCLARNNYRVYEEVDSGKILFFPHGMDQLLGSPDLPWQPQMSGLVARAVLKTPEGKQRYHACFSSMFTNLWVVTNLDAQVDRLVARIQPVLTASEFSDLKTAAETVKRRIVARQLNLEAQLRKDQLSAPTFNNGICQLTTWETAADTTAGTFDRVNSPDGRLSLHILTHSETTAAWKTGVLLSPGRYRFEANAMVAGVKPLPFGNHQGAGLRVAGQKRQSADLTGDSAWQTLAAEFEVGSEDSLIELICELRAGAGEVWFDCASLRLMQKSKF